MNLTMERGQAGKIRLQRDKRRSIRRELELSIRVYGTDFQGKDFVEDSTTLVVSRHGAKIQLIHQLMPEQEIRILCQGNNREGLFRVVGQAGETTGQLSFWGVECLKPEENIWQGASPKPRQPAPQPVAKPSPIAAPKPKTRLPFDEHVAKPSPIAAPKPKTRLPLDEPVAKPRSAKPKPVPEAEPSVPVKSPIQVSLRCSGCGMRELVEVEVSQIQSLRKLKGLVRTCPACGATGLWKPARI